MTCRVLKPEAEIYNVNLQLPKLQPESAFSDYLNNQENLSPPRYRQDPLFRQLVSAPVLEEVQLSPPVREVLRVTDC